MLNIKVQSTSVEENFVFGSPPLLNGFFNSSCRSQEGLLKAKQDSFNGFNVDCCFEPGNPMTCEPTMSATTSDIKRTKGFQQQHKFPLLNYTRNYPNIQSYTKNGCRNNIESTTESLNQLNIGNLHASHVDKGIMILEQAGFKVQQSQQVSEPVFKKRKDLRVLKLALSNERFREVAMKFGDGDEGGKEISESVHRTMRNENTTQVTCVSCKTDCQVYENFPIVDGTLFLTPIKRTPECIRFVDPTQNQDRYLGFICVSCMEGQRSTLCCAGCNKPWNGSFFQVGTMYSYDILAAMPCCEVQVSCKNCGNPVLDISKGELSTLFFSNFSSKSICPHCKEDDFHFVKPFSMYAVQDNVFP